MSNADHQLDACHCCEGIRSLTPEDHSNRPGLPVLAYRVGTHGTFKATMLARLSRMPALGSLGTRADEDLTIALLDAWATVADVMTFYIERSANEGFVRTATEQRSVQELARSIGYAPHPGVAASTYLAFTVEDGPGAAEDVPIPAGTRAQSTPGGDELPQTFETIEELAAHPEWNALRPRQTEPQLISATTRVIYLDGIDTRLNPGDWMLLRAGENVMRRRSLVFVVSDFISAPGWAEVLGRLAQRHEVIAVRLHDPLEAELPDLGLVVVQDAETGEQLFVDTNDRGFRKRFAAAAAKREADLRAAFREATVDAIELSTNDDLVETVLRFADLKRRGRHSKRQAAPAA